MATKIDICSMALLKMGEAPIQSLVDDTAQAQLARTLFDPVIDALIASHPWRFACEALELKPRADGKFQIPGDLLRIVKCSGQIVGDTIISPRDTVSIVAMRRVAPEKMPPYFVSLAATKLATEFCIPRMGDQTVFRMLVALYETELQSAKFIDSTMARNSAIDRFSLIDARF